MDKKKFWRRRGHQTLENIAARQGVSNSWNIEASWVSKHRMQGERRGGGGTYIIYGASRLYTCVLRADAHTNLMPTLSLSLPHIHTLSLSPVIDKAADGNGWEREREGKGGWRHTREGGTDRAGVLYVVLNSSSKSKKEEYSFLSQFFNFLKNFDLSLFFYIREAYSAGKSPK